MNPAQEPTHSNYDQPLKAFSIFGVFAFAYLLSAALRSVNAVLAPELIREFGLSASALGLLSAMYFLGFTAMQWPLGPWLDRYGPRRVECALLLITLLGVALFAMAQSLTWLIVGRLLFGVGVASCLMAPYTGYRRWFSSTTNARFASWMLSCGSLGMILSTLPVQWALPLIGWRAVFWVGFAMVALAIVLIWFFSPREPWQAVAHGSGSSASGYREVVSHSEFKLLIPFMLFMYGGLLAIQTLWIGPWFTQVAGWSAANAAWGVLHVHAAMGLMFFVWGTFLPRLLARGYTAPGMIKKLLPLGFALTALVIVVSPHAPAWAAVLWALAFAGISVTGLSQITIARSFPVALAGRINTATNLLLFSGAFIMQWAIGGMIDGFRALGMSLISSYQAAFAVVLLLMIASWAWYALDPRKMRQHDIAINSAT